MTFQIDLYRVILLVAVLLILAAFGWLAFIDRGGSGKRRIIVLGCRRSHASYNDRAGDTFVLGVVAVGVLALCMLAIMRDKAADSAVWAAILMAIINAIKESRQARSAERTINAVTPGTGSGSGTEGNQP